MLYVVLYYKAPDTLKGCTKWLSTGLEEKGNKRRAAALIPEYIEKYRFLENAPAGQSADIPFVDYYKSWLEKKKTDGSIEMSTWEGYKLHSTHIIDYFSNNNIRLCELTPKHFQEYYDTNCATEKQTGKLGSGAHLPRGRSEVTRTLS